MVKNPFKSQSQPQPGFPSPRRSRGVTPPSSWSSALRRSIEWKQPCWPLGSTPPGTRWQHHEYALAQVSFTQSTINTNKISWKDIIFPRTGFLFFYVEAKYKSTWFSNQSILFVLSVDLRINCITADRGSFKKKIGSFTALIKTRS